MNNPPQTFLDIFQKAKINNDNATQYWIMFNEELDEEFILWLYQQSFFSDENKQKLEEILSDIIIAQKAEKNIFEHIKPMLDCVHYNQCIDKYSLLFTLKLKQIYNLIELQSKIINSSNYE